MGAEEDANITVDPVGCGVASGGISASLRDYAQFGLLMLNEGVVNGCRVIPQSWIDDVRSGEHGLFSDQNRQRFPRCCYRNQFWIEDDRQTAHLTLLLQKIPARNRGAASIAASKALYSFFLNIT